MFASADSDRKATRRRRRWMRSQGGEGVGCAGRRLHRNTQVKGERVGGGKHEAEAVLNGRGGVGGDPHYDGVYDDVGAAVMAMNE